MIFPDFKSRVRIGKQGWVRHIYCSGWSRLEMVGSSQASFAICPSQFNSSLLSVPSSTSHCWRWNGIRELLKHIPLISNCSYQCYSCFPSHLGTVLNMYKNSHFWLPMHHLSVINISYSELLLFFPLRPFTYSSWFLHLSFAASAWPLASLILSMAQNWPKSKTGVAEIPLPYQCISTCPTFSLQNQL